MAVQDSVAWPPGYRAISLGIAMAGVGFSFLAALLAIFWSPWFAALAIGGGVAALASLAVWHHMGQHPMLAMEGGALLCRLKSSNSQRQVKLKQVVRFPLDQIESLQREVSPWPGGGERHVYRLRLASGVTRTLVPRPSDAATRQAMAAFFDRHLPGRVNETRLG